jgi:hypothetical protein
LNADIYVTYDNPLSKHSERAKIERDATGWWGKSERPGDEREHANPEAA